MVQLNDSVTGATTEYFGFSSATGGGFAIKASSGTGYQVGTFVLLDTTSPTIAITSPTSGQNWSNSVFTITGTASDNVQLAAVYYQINSQGWNLASSANNWANWNVVVTLIPGTNIISAYAVDTSGNASTTKQVSFNYVSTPPKLAITHSGTNVILTWPTNATGFTLQSTTNFVSQTFWNTNLPSPVVVNTNYVVTNIIISTKQFYRLTHF